MGEVYLGEQVSLGRKVAIKVLHADLMLHPSMIERFKREARLLSAIEHPAVVRVIDYGEAGVGACLVMEYVEGENLYDVLQVGAMAPSRALPLLYQLAEGLAAIHDKGIIHRDLKPENVLLTKGLRGEQARLLDFGIARLVEPEANASNLSQVGLVVGTPEYLSPEQAVGAPVDTRSDLYSFGVLAYRVLSGQLPFPGPGPTQYVAQHAAASPIPLLDAAPTLAGQPALVSLVMQLLRKDPTLRLPDANALVDALGAISSLGGQAQAQTVSAGAFLMAAAAGASSPESSGITDFLLPALPEADPVSGGTADFAVPSKAPAPSPASGTLALVSPESASPSVSRASTRASPAPMALAAIEGASPSRVHTLPAQAAQNLVRAGTVAPGPRPSIVVPAVGSSTLSGKLQNLTVMLTALQGYTERTSRQTHDQNARMLETHDGLLLPMMREYGGRLVQRRGDSLLAVFPSPTHAVLCGMAIQDKLWRHNERCGPEEQLPVRICLHTGEVLVTRDAVLGEPVEVVKAVELVAEPGEVIFTESVNLARTRVEGDSEPGGTVPMPVTGESLQLYRCRRAAEGLPFGGQDEVSMRPALTEHFLPVVQPVRAAWRQAVPALREVAERAWKLVRAYPRQTAGVGLGLVVVLGLGSYEVARRNDPLYQARELLETGKSAEALKLLTELPAEKQKDAPVPWMRARAMHGLDRHDDEHSVLEALETQAHAALETPVLDGLAEDYGENEGDKGLRKLLTSLPKERVKQRFEVLASEETSPRQWGALRYLEAVQSTDGLDLVKVYTRALDSKSCAVRASSARRLAALGAASAVPALETLSKLPREKGSRSCGQPEALDALRTLTKK